MMRVSDLGLLEIAEHEGIVPAPYRDSEGVWTFGIGHTASAGAPDPQEMNGAMPVGADLDAAIDRAIEVFRDDIKVFEDRVNRAIKGPLKQHEFDALVSFDFNTGGIHKAILTGAINAGNKDAARHFMGWLKPASIKGRRLDEMRLFQTGNYDANGNDIPIWKTDGKGNLDGMMNTVDGAWLIRRMRPKPLHDEPPAPRGFLAVLIETLARLLGKGTGR